MIILYALGVAFYACIMICAWIKFLDYFKCNEFKSYLSLFVFVLMLALPMLYWCESISQRLGL